MFLKGMVEMGAIPVDPGQLADFTANGGRLTDLPGVGQAKAEKLEEGLERFWERRRADLPAEPATAAE